MPATYAAAIAVFNALREVCELAPRSLIDVGAGPGTVAFAAMQAFPSLADIRLVEANAEMRALGAALLAQADQPALRAASYGPLPGGTADAPAADLVTASYVAGEIAPAERARLRADAVGGDGAGAGRDRAGNAGRLCGASSRCAAC